MIACTIYTRLDWTAFSHYLQSQEHLFTSVESEAARCSVIFSNAQPDGRRGPGLGKAAYQPAPQST